MYKMHKTTVT